MKTKKAKKGLLANFKIEKQQLLKIKGGHVVKFKAGSDLADAVQAP